MTNRMGSISSLIEARDLRKWTILRKEWSRVVMRRREVKLDKKWLKHFTSVEGRRQERKRKAGKSVMLRLFRNRRLIRHMHRR
jgi:hypothetical protein